MGPDLVIGSRPLAPNHDFGVGDTLKTAAVGAVVGTGISAAFHHFGPPKMEFGAPWAKATLGVGLMFGLSSGLLGATNNTGKETNSMLESTLLSTIAFGVPGILIHGKMDFSGKPVKTAMAALGVAATGAAFGPLIHQATAPRD